MSRPRRAGAARVWRATAILITLTACSPGSGEADHVAEPPPGGPPGIRGTITARRPDVLLVEENPADRAGTAKASVRLTPQTRIRRQGGGAAPPDSLRVGRRVSVWFAGPVAESYPVQGTAAAVVLENDGG